MIDRGEAASPSGARPQWVEAFVRLIPGLALALAVALAALAGEALLRRAGLRVPALVVALIIGMAAHGVTRAPAFAPGLTFALKKLLRWAIALLGLKIAFSDIWALGFATAAIVIVTMTATLVSGVVFARLLGRGDSYGALAGGATAVCGASAALAISSVLPPGKEREADTVFVVLAVNALSTVAMLAYPLLAYGLGFDDRATGVLLGATIHDVAQVVGAGYSVSEPVGNSAVIVKLFRVFLLLPVVLGVGYYFAGGAGARQARPPVPVFAIMFLVMAAVNSIGVAPAWLRETLLAASGWGLLLAISALGVNTSVRSMIKLGWRHLAVVTATTLLLLALVVAPLVVIG